MRYEDYTSACNTCSVMFTAISISKGRVAKLFRKYCTEKCKNNRYRTRTGKCNVCSAIFQYKTRSSHRRMQCSKACQDKSIATLRAPEREKQKTKREYLKNKEAERRKKVLPEVSILIKIKNNIKNKKIFCLVCKKHGLRARKYAETCSLRCEVHRRERSRIKSRKKHWSNPRRRARHYNVKYEPINPMLVLQRDGWVCHMCGVKTKPSLRGSIDDLAPEIDHIVPMSRGGDHTWGNVACSCRRCNSKKSNTPLGQIGFNFPVN